MTGNIAAAFYRRVHLELAHRPGGTSGVRADLVRLDDEHGLIERLKGHRDDIRTWVAMITIQRARDGRAFDGPSVMLDDRWPPNLNPIDYVPGTRTEQRAIVTSRSIDAYAQDLAKALTQ